MTLRPRRLTREFGAVAALRRLYRLLLLAHPEAVRREYGGELWDTARALEQDVASSDTPFALTRFWLREVIALLGSAVRAHVDLRRRDGRLDLRQRSVGSDGPGRVAPDGRRGPDRAAREPLRRLLQDLRHAVRLLFRRPSYAILTVLTLALGVGANTVIFSVIDGVLFEVFPGLDGSRLIHVWERNLAQGGDRWELAPADFEDYRERTRTLAALGGYGHPRELTYLSGVEPRVIAGLPVSVDFFEVVGAHPLYGRGFLEGEDDPEAGSVVALSHAFWRSELGGDPDVLGRTLRLEDEVAEVVAVMPPGFHVQSRPVDLWFPVWVDTDQSWSRTFHYWYGVGRLAAGATVEDAERELLALAHRLEAEHPETNEGHLVNVVPLREAIVGDVRPALLILMGVVGLVLLIACSNVANMSLVQATHRRREMAVRAALGAGRWDLTRLALVEGAMVALLGGLLGVALAGFGLDALVALSPLELPGWAVIELDGSVLAFTLVTMVGVGLFLGFAPALSIASANVAGALKEGGRASGPGLQQRQAQRAFLVVQLTLAALLLVGAGLMLRSFSRLRHVDPGARVDNVLTAEVQLNDSRYPDHAARLPFWTSLLERMESLPGVSAAAVTSVLPVRGGGFGSSLTTEAPGQPEIGSRPPVRVRYVHPGYFQVMGIPLRDGRALSESDSEDRPPVAVINETMARRFWPGGRAVGNRFKLGTNLEGQPWIEIVGVIRDVREQGLAAEALPAVYLSNTQNARLAMKLVLRTDLPPPDLVPGVRSELRALDPSIPLHAVQTMSAVVGQSVERQRSTAFLLGAFAVLATLLAALGVYGVVSFSVARRAREIAVRIALGADRIRILTTVVGEVTMLAVGAVALGLLVSLGLTRVLHGLLYEVSTLDPVTLGASPALLLAVAMAAAYLPARRAARLDPARTLQDE